jgi:hypothetical protein
MPYNAGNLPAPPMNNPQSDWMKWMQWYGALTNGSNPGTPSAVQSSALAAGQGPLNQGAAMAWDNSQYQPPNLGQYMAGLGVASAPAQQAGGGFD